MLHYSFKQLNTMRKERKVFTFLLETESGKQTALQVLCEGNKGLSWDYPIKPGEAVKGVDEVLELFDWKEEE